MAKAEPVQRITYVKPINHLFHGTMTVLTGGLWGIVWGLKVINRRATR